MGGTNIAKRCGHCRKLGHNRRSCPALRECGKVHADGRVCVLLVGHNGRACASIEGEWLVSWSEPKPVDVGRFIGAGI